MIVEVMLVKVLVMTSLVCSTTIPALSDSRCELVSGFAAAAACCHVGSAFRCSFEITWQKDNLAFNYAS